MGAGTQTHQEPTRRDSPTHRGSHPDPHPTPQTQPRPSLNVGPAFARTVRHFFPQLNGSLDRTPDARDPERSTYGRRFLLWYGILLFVTKLGSRRQLDFRLREQGTCVLQNLNRLAQTDQATLPHNDTLDDYLQTLDTPAVAAVRQQMISRLIRMRVLDRARVQSRLVVAVDGTGYLSFQKRHCDHCLTRKAGKHTRYSHQVLEAKLLGPAQTVLSLASVFIDNRDLTDPDVGEEKQKVRC